MVADRADLERAVIEAARVMSDEGVNDHWTACALVVAVEELRKFEREQAAAGISEVEWSLVAEGDELRSNTGAFFPVVATKREWKMGSATGKFLITVQLTAGPKVLTRPSPAAPMATVRRGQAGKAVDTIVHVMSSGEAS
jgi:hypothetical protein